MPSGKRSKELRRTVAAAPPPVRSKGVERRRQANPKVLAAVAAVVVLAAVGIGLGIALSGGNSSGVPKNTPTVGSLGANALPGASEVQKLFKGIPQNGFYLGSPFAPVQMVMYIDLQCPICQNYETTAMPTLVSKYVRPGKVRIEVRPWAFIGTDSVRGQAAMIAAAEQNKAWNFAELLYVNQGAENSGWLDDSMIAQAAASVPGMKVYQLLSDRNARSVKQKQEQVDASAQANGVTGTPTVFVGKNGAKPAQVGSPGAAPTLADTEAAIKQALSS